LDQQHTQFKLDVVEFRLEDGELLEAGDDLFGILLGHLGQEGRRTVEVRREMQQLHRVGEGEA
jgi:hypothetical protein